jgi:hypothetical protein
MQIGLGRFLKKNLLEVILFTGFFIFSCLLMWKTFGLTPDGNIQIASKAWSDFAATLPLIRSFSLGSNFPPEYPIFAGPPIRYHFVFFLIVGFLEKTGIPLDWALNTLSVFGIFALLVIIYFIGKVVFKSKAVGVISTILFLFNGSFGFLEFFKNKHLSLNTLVDIYKNTDFSSFGPYDGKIVSAFWNLNIYTNQRHLALAYGFFLFLVLLIYKFSNRPEKFTWNKTLILGIALGLFPFVHFSVFIMTGVSLILFLILYPKIRQKIFTIGFIALLLAIPQYLYMGQPEIKTNIFNPGYLVENMTTFNFLKYWFLNLGITAFLAPVGFLLAKKPQRKILIPFLIFFIIGNLFQFTPDMPTNHKFFNFFLIGINFFTAFFLYKIYLKNILGKVLVIIIFPFLILSGVIDLFPIINDKYITIQDIPNNKIASFIADNTPKDSVFLNSSYLYNPASIAGRKIFMGWPYFAWSAGYDTDKRGKVMEKIYTSNSKTEVCTFLKQNSIDYFMTENTKGNPDFPDINFVFFDENFKSEYKDRGVTIFRTSVNCF